MRTPVTIRTDDEGRYRVYALPPGMYVVTATDEYVRMIRLLSFGRTSYPGTMNESEAQTIRVDFGQDAVASFSMIPAKQGSRVGLRFALAQGRPAAGHADDVERTATAPAIDQADVSLPSGDGTFTFEHPAAGPVPAARAAERRTTADRTPANDESGAPCM